MLKSFCQQYINHYNYTKYFTNSNKISGSFIISLPKDMNKYNNAKNILNKLQLDPIKINAIYGNDLKHNELSTMFKDISYPEIGCFLSHVITLYIISQHQNKDGYTMIFEDDITIKDYNIHDKILKVMSYNPNLIYLGKCLEMCGDMKPINTNEHDIFYGYKPLCLHAYMVKNSFATTIIEYIMKQQLYTEPIDRLILEATKKNDIMVFHPSLFYQNLKYDSNLRGRFAQKFNVMDCRVIDIKYDYTNILLLMIVIITMIIIYKL